MCVRCWITGEMQASCPARKLGRHMCEMLLKPSRLNSGHADGEGASAPAHFSGSGRKALGAPQSMHPSKVVSEWSLGQHVWFPVGSLTPALQWRAQQKAERIHALRKTWGQRRRMSSTQKS